jgi:hypothetical protein
MVRFLVSDDGISWVESRNGHELIKLEGAAAIEELDRVARVVQGLGSLVAVPAAEPLGPQEVAA